MEIFFLNGKFLPAKKALIKINNLGFIRGYGVFDYLRTFERKPFEVELHFKRLLQSARILKLKCPLSEKKFKKIISTLIEKNKHLKELGIRTILTGGETKDGKMATSPSFFIIVTKPHFYPKIFYQKGVKIILKEFKRTFPEAKTIDYIFPLAFQNLLKKEKAFEILYFFKEKVLECSTSNFFIVKNESAKRNLSGRSAQKTAIVQSGGKIITPQKDILKGVTRDVIIKLAKKNSFKVEERDVSIKEMLMADEAFLTGTDKKIMPVVKVDGKKIGQGKVGETTKKLIKIFENYITK